MIIAAASVPDRLDRWPLLALAAFVAAVQFSIAVSQILLALTVFLWLARLHLRRERPAAPPFFTPLAVYAGLTLVSCAFSSDPVASLRDSRQLLLFLVVPVTYALATRDRAPLLITTLITAGAISATIGVVQYALLQYDTLGRRPDGALSHYMTYAGTLMLVLTAVVARLVFAPRGRAWAAVVMPALVGALVLTFTRNAWVGALAGIALLLLLRDFRLIGIVPILVALVFALAPPRITTRMMSMFDLQDPSNRDRVAMARMAGAIVRDHPLTGAGPNMIPRIYDRYRSPDPVNVRNPHLHNVPLQIAAERGLPALAAWLAFIAACTAGLVRLARRPDVRPLAATGLGALAAMLSAGLFEYNFGDSEVLMLFLFLITLPFAAARERT